MRPDPNRADLNEFLPLGLRIIRTGRRVRLDFWSGQVGLDILGVEVLGPARLQTFEHFQVKNYYI